MSFAIERRPFAIEPITGIMMPDGIFDAAIPQQKIACHLTNTSDQTVSGVALWVKAVSDTGFAVSQEIRTSSNVAPGASILFEWPVSLASITPGEVTVTFGYSYWLKLGDHYGMVGSLVAPFEIEKKVFVSETTFDQGSKTYTCTVPEGTINVKLNGVIGSKKLKKWKNAAYGRKHIYIGPILLTDFELSVTPSKPYTGKHGDIPFKDPWWKVVAWVVFVVALIAAVIAAVLGYGTAYIGLKGEDFVNVETGDPECYNCEVDTWGGPAMGSAAGVLSIVAMIALVVALMDEADPFHRGQLATDPSNNEKTKAEQVKVALKYIDPPTPGSAYRMGVKWDYERITNLTTYKHNVSETIKNTHLLEKAVIKTNRSDTKVDQSVTIEARFYRNARRKYKNSDLYVNALLKAPNGHAHLLRLEDVKGNGVYRNTFTPIEIAALWSLKDDGIKGRWEIYVSAQDTNDAREGIPPREAATHIGGYPIYTPFTLSIDGTESCPHSADVDVNVT